MTSSSDVLKKRVEAVLDMAVTTVSSLTESFQSGTFVLQEDAVVGRETEQELSDKPEDSGDLTVQASEAHPGDTLEMEVVDVDAMEGQA